MSNPNGLIEVLNAAPGDRTAVLLPEAGIRITYKDLRDQVMAMADTLAALGIRRGDRVATVLPERTAGNRQFSCSVDRRNGCPSILGIAKMSSASTWKILGAKILLCPPDGAEEARRAAQGKVPIYSLQMDDNGFVRIEDVVGNQKQRRGPFAG